MNYSMIGFAAAKYGLAGIRTGVFFGGCFISYGGGLIRGEKRARAKMDVLANCAHTH
jgi:hypothetical protein